MIHENLQINSIEVPERLKPLAELGIATDSEARAEQLRDIDGTGVRSLISRIHEIVAPDLSHEPSEVARHIQSPDGSNRRKLVEPEERQALFDHAAQLVTELEQFRTKAGDTEPFLKRAGNVLALSVVLAHNFEDGNGRSARTLGELVRDGYDPTSVENIENLTIGSQNRPETGHRILTYLPTNLGVDLTPTELLDTAAALEIPLSSDDMYQKQKGQYFTTPYSD